MPILAAARETDPVAHSFEFFGKILGSIVGAVAGAILIIGSLEVPVLVPLAVGFAGMGIAGGGQAGGRLVHAIEKKCGGPRVSGHISKGSPNVRIEDLAAARAVLDTAECDGMYLVFHAPMPLFGLGSGPRIAEGSKTVLINDKPAARVSMLLECSAIIKDGSKRVFIGGPTARELFVPGAFLEESLDLFLNKLGELSALVERFLFRAYAAAGLFLVLGPDAGKAAWDGDYGGKAFDALGWVIGTSIKGYGMLAEALLGPGWGDIVEESLNLILVALPILHLPEIVRNVRLPEPTVPKVSGAGGQWEVFDETPGGTVGQSSTVSCGAACGETLSGIPQAELIKRAGAPTSAESLAKAMGPEWKGGTVGNEHFSDLMGLGRPWIAELYEGGKLGHLVIVEAEEAGMVRIQDPWNGGSTYTMTLDEFQRVWNGRAVFK